MPDGHAPAGRRNRCLTALWLGAVGVASAAAATGAASILSGLRHPEGMIGRIDEARGWKIRSLVGGPPGGAVVVMIHGLGVSGSYMVPTAQRLVSQLRVHIPDLPGHGLTDGPPDGLDIRQQAEVLSAWMRARGLRQALVVGNSMGCQTAVELAALDPELVDGLILVGPTSDVRARSMLGHLVRLLAVAPFERMSLHVLLAADYLRLGPRRMLTEVRSMLRYRIERVMKTIDVPMLVVRGSHDLIVPHRWAAMLAGIAGTPLVTVPRSGHAVNYGRPEELARVIVRFAAALERHRGAARALPEAGRIRSPA
jgi:2-hydroxy-6-oxonona-2,4-dienedioate hydrolase